MKLTKKQSWWVYGALGALLLGSGFSLAAEASHWKHTAQPFWQWTLGGIAGIGLLLSGVVLLIKAGILERELHREKNTK